MKASPQGENDARLYQIYIGSKGELLDPYTRNVVKKESAYLDDIFRRYEEEKAKRQASGLTELQLVIFIHGGLNSFEHATERVDRVQEQMRKEGRYPLFISWDSGFPGNYRDHLFVVRRGINRPVVGTMTSPIIFVEDVARTIVHIPVALYNVLFGQRSTYGFWCTAEQRAAAQSRKTLDDLGQFHIVGPEQDVGRPFGDLVQQVNPVKLVTAPLIDGLGKGAWDSMLRRTDLVLRKTRDFYGVPIEVKEQQHIETKKHESPAQAPEKKGPEAEAPASTAAAEFLRRWELYSTDNKEKPAILIGHSMGTIIANNILSKYPRIKYQDIVYMGAAARLKDVEMSVAPYLEKNEDTQFFGLSLHPNREVNEAHYYDVIPRGSLLVWIDDTLADINSFQDRTAGSWYNMMRSANQVFVRAQMRRRVHLTHFGIQDGSPQNHGDFGLYPFWREGFWTFTNYNQHACRPEQPDCPVVPLLEEQPGLAANSKRSDACLVPPGS